MLDVVCCFCQDKILQSMGRTNDIMVTNDGATILKSLYVDNPAAKVLVGEFTSSVKCAAKGPHLHASCMFCHLLVQATGKAK